MKSWFFVLSLFVASSAFGDADKVLVSAGRTAIFPKETAPGLVEAVCYSPPDGITSFWTPEEKNLGGIENDLESYLKKWLSADKTRSKYNGQNPDWNWSLYYRQVTGVIIEGKNLLFISYYLGPSPEEEAKRENDRKESAARRGLPYTPSPDRWKKHPLHVDDGGYFFFGSFTIPAPNLTFGANRTLVSTEPPTHSYRAARPR